MKIITCFIWKKNSFVTKSTFRYKCPQQSKVTMKRSRIRYKQTILLMLMQNSWQIIMQIHNEKKKLYNVFNLMYNTLILLSMKWVKQRK